MSIAGKPYSYGWENPPLYKGRLVEYYEKIVKPPQPLLKKEGIEFLIAGVFPIKPRNIEGYRIRCKLRGIWIHSGKKNLCLFTTGI